MLWRLGARGFSLIETATAVAIAMTLAAMAIPKLYEAQLKAKVAEMPLNTDGIIGAEVMYEAAMGAFLDCAGNTPGSSAMSKSKRAWDSGPVACYDTLGWRPDGDVYATYYTQVLVGTDLYSGCHCGLGGSAREWVYALAMSNVDGDGQMRWWMRCAPDEAVVKEGLCSAVTSY